MLFQPVYIGYEKLMEGNSYLDELTGRPKEKESIWGLLWSIPKVLKQNYGQVVVNFGEPIALNDVLAKHAPDWDGQPLPEDEKPTWLAPAVDTLSTQIQTRINCAADVNPINLLALALLSTPKHAMGEADLIAQIQLCKKLLAEMPYSDRVTVTPHTPARIITHAEEINVLTRVSHPLGDVLSVSGDTAGVAQLLPQQRAAFVYGIVLGGVLLPEQPPHEPRRSVAPGPHGVPVPAGRVVLAVERRSLCRTH